MECDKLKKPIYLDYNATTPVDPLVLEAMLPFFKEYFGNPSSSHSFGKSAKEAVEKAREQVAKLIGAEPHEIVFISGGTESNNYAIIGTAFANLEKGNHIITSKIEQSAVLETVQYLQDRFNFKVTYLPVDRYGMINPPELQSFVTSKTTLITIMHANNEVGTINPIEEITEIAEEKGITLHTDAAQSCSKIPVNVDNLNVDFLTIAGHKLYAPKGIGALYIREGTNLDKYIHRAGQEGGRRAGTENVPYIAGMGKACQIASDDLSTYSQNIRALRDRLYKKLVDGLGADRVKLNGHPEKRLPNTLNVSIKDVVGEDLLSNIPQIAASTGSACHAGLSKPSAVLLAMGLSEKQALEALRLSLGRWTTREEVAEAARLIIEHTKGTTQSLINFRRNLGLFSDSLLCDGSKHKAHLQSFF
jgi:cysteine desulfurase